MTTAPMTLFCSGMGWQLYWQLPGNYYGLTKISNENQFKKDITKLYYSVLFIKEMNLLLNL